MVKLPLLLLLRRGLQWANSDYSRTKLLCKNMTAIEARPVMQPQGGSLRNLLICCVISMQPQLHTCAIFRKYHCSALAEALLVFFTTSPSSPAKTSSLDGIVA
jgi:hypothetical protein